MYKRDYTIRLLNKLMRWKKKEIKTYAMKKKNTQKLYLLNMRAILVTCILILFHYQHLFRLLTQRQPDFNLRGQYLCKLKKKGFYFASQV